MYQVDVELPQPSCHAPRERQGAHGIPDAGQRAGACGRPVARGQVVGQPDHLDRVARLLEPSDERAVTEEDDVDGEAARFPLCQRVEEAQERELGSTELGRVVEDGDPDRWVRRAALHGVPAPAADHRLARCSRWRGTRP